MWPLATEEGGPHHGTAITEGPFATGWPRTGGFLLGTGELLPAPDTAQADVETPGLPPQQRHGDASSPLSAPPAS